MGAGDAQMRIGEIQARLARLATPTATRLTDPVRPAASGVSGASAVQFAQALDAAVASGAGRWVSPLQGKITSEFGPRWGRQHNGVDFAAATGTPVRAAAGGTVRMASWHGGYGNAVIIDHADGTSTLYGHASQLMVKPGERVDAGQVISLVGSTGNSTGPHLHFEVRQDGRAVEPRAWFREHGVTI